MPQERRETMPGMIMPVGFKVAPGPVECQICRRVVSATFGEIPHCATCGCSYCPHCLTDGEPSLHCPRELTDCPLGLPASPSKEACP